MVVLVVVDSIEDFKERSQGEGEEGRRGSVA